MDKIMKVKLPLKFELLYLGKLNVAFTRFGDKYMFKLLITSRKAMIRKWLNKVDVFFQTRTGLIQQKMEKLV